MRCLQRLMPILCILGLAAPALAQEQGDELPGRASARSFAALPAPLVVSVVAGDNTDENIALAQQIARALTARGATVVDKGAPLIFRFDTEVRPNSTVPQRRTFYRDRTTSETDRSRTPSRTVESPNEVTNLLSSGGDGLIGPRPGSTGYGRSLNYVINATVDTVEDGKRLWQGHVGYSAAEPDRAAVFQAIAPFLIEQLGRTVQQRRFVLE